MKFEKKYKIGKWTEWNRFIADAADDFYVIYSFQANILEANQYTHSQFDFLVNIIPSEKRNLYRKDEISNRNYKPKENEEASISSFMNQQNLIDFAVNDNLDDKEFILIYDSDPDWGNENVDYSPVETEKRSVIILDN